MTDERVREIAEQSASAKSYEECAEVIRLALAERDREVADWVKNNAQTYTHNREYGCVATADLLAFLEAGT